MLLKGLILGFSVAAPVGPIGLLCIQRTLNRGRLYGFFSGLGAATADTVYGMIAALGLTALSSFLLGLQSWLQLGGGLFLLWLGGRTIVARPTTAAPNQPTQATGLTAAFGSIFLLTLANPATILAFIAVFSGLGMSTQMGEISSALLLVIGVFLGSASWWLLLSFFCGMWHGRLKNGHMRLINILAGFSILLLGLWSLWPVLRAKLL